jgi:hypothetical protein
MLDRQTLTDAWTAYFDGYKHGYFISLNSKMRVEGREDKRAYTKHIKLDTMVQEFVHRLNQKCYGRRYDRKEDGARLKCLAGYEIGSIDGLIHCHLLAAHDGSVTRDTEKIRNIAHQKWDDVCGTWGRTQFVDVADLDNIQDRIWYLTKQSTNYQRQFGEFNIIPV